MSKKDGTEAQKTKHKEKKIEDPKGPSLDLNSIFSSFTNNLDSLKSFVDTLSPLVIKKLKTRLKHFETESNKILQKSGVGIKSRAPKEKPKIEISDRDLIRLFRLIPTVEAQHINILMSSSFVLLISYFEFLFSDLLSFFYTKHYRQLTDVRLAIGELDHFENLEEAKYFYISKEVENLLLELKTFNDIKKHYSEKLAVSLDEEIIDWQVISDARERRHLIVHNNGIINRKFLHSIDVENAADKNDLKIGEKVKIGLNIFKQVYTEIYSAGIFMIFNCWGQHQKKDIDKAIRLLLMFSFDSLKNGNYEVVEKLGSYLKIHKLEGRTEEQDDLLLRIRFNYCISLKKQKKKEELAKELTKIKTATLSPIFKIAHCALSDKRDEAINQLEPAKIADNLLFEEIEDWVLFDELRKDKVFMDKARAVLL
ncbi:MAG: hypothetical protein WBD16_00580 [Pyrinomonadaceae bacterium]